jgi:hypothetical protein
VRPATRPRVHCRVQKGPPGVPIFMIFGVLGAELGPRSALPCLVIELNIP